MRAAVFDRYGSPEVLRLADVDPPAPADDEVLVRVRATTVNRTDCGFRQGSPVFVRLFFGLTRPKRHILGSELAGVVEAVGSAVTTFSPGDEVFGVNADRYGAHAELVCVREQGPLAHKPPGASFEEAAAVCDGFVLAHTCLRWGKVTAGQRVMVYGASGSIGTAGVQLAKHLGAVVTAVCSTKDVALVRSLGADEVLDYTAEPFVRPGDAYDVVFDAVGKLAYGQVRGGLARRGLFLSTDFGPRAQVPFLAALTAVTGRLLGSRRVLLPLPRYKKEHVLEVKELLEAGAYRAVIDRTWPLEDVVEATRYVETGQKTGNVVLTVTSGG